MSRLNSQTNIRVKTIYDDKDKFDILLSNEDGSFDPNNMKWFRLKDDPKDPNDYFYIAKFASAEHPSTDALLCTYIGRTEKLRLEGKTPFRNPFPREIQIYTKYDIDTLETTEKERRENECCWFTEIAETTFEEFMAKGDEMELRKYHSKFMEPVTLNF